MYNLNTNLNQPLAADTDTVYAPNNFEHMFDEASEAAADEQQVQAETQPHPLTVATVPGAGTTATQETAMRVITLLQRDYAAAVSDVLAAGHSGFEDMSALALLCARDAASTLSVDLHRLDDEARSTLIKRFARLTEVGSAERHFWSAFTGLLFMYFGRFGEPDWEPLPGICRDDEPAYSMPAWRTDDDVVVCDLLVQMTPWDSDANIWDHIAPALHLAREEFGDRLAGLRVVPPMAGYLARWYHPDGSWEPWFEDVPNFYDLLDQALAEEAKS